jgi:hypothetical protein
MTKSDRAYKKVTANASGDGYIVVADGIARGHASDDQVAVLLGDKTAPPINPNERLTEVADIREHLGQEADWMNLFIATSAGVENRADEDALAYRLAEADTLTIEGYVLHPRRLQCLPVELSITDADDADYVLRLIRESAGLLPAMSGSALELASEVTPASWIGNRLGAGLEPSS